MYVAGREIDPDAIEEGSDILWRLWRFYVNQ